MNWLRQLCRKYFGKEEVKESPLQYTFWGLNPEIIRTTMYKHSTGEKWGEEWILIWWRNFLFQRTTDYYRGPLERFLEQERDLKMTPKENTLFMLEVYEHFGCSGPITQSQIDKYKSIKLGRLSQQEEETMNDNLNNAPTTADTAEANKVMDNFEKLTDEQFEVLLAEGKPLDGTAVYLTDADETADEPTPTVH